MPDYYNYNVAPSLKQAMVQRKHMAYYSLDSAIRAAEDHVRAFRKGTVVWGARYEGSRTILERVRTVRANPSAKPSLIGDITESFVPLDLMERTAQGAFSDVSRLSHTPRKRRNPLYRVKFEDTGTRLYSTYDLRKAKEYAKGISHQGNVVVEKWSDDGAKLKGVVYTHGSYGKRNPPDAVVHVVRAGRGKYVVRGIEVANCGSHCPSLPNPNVIFKSLAKVKTWAKGLFKGDRRNRKVEMILQD